MKKITAITDMLEKYQYKNTDKGIFAYVETANGKEEVSIQSNYFMSIVADDYRLAHNGETISYKTIREGIFTYQGTILKTHKRIKTGLRINRDEDENILRIDLGNTNYEYIEVSAGKWKICSDGDKYFTRKRSQGELPIPVKNGDFWKIFDYCRISNPDMKLVFAVYIISCFIDIIHPCLVLQGSAGSSKSTLSTLLKMLIDPCTGNNSPFIFPKNETDLIYMYSNNYFVAYDNLQKLKQKQSDYLCSIITGTKALKRKLFTNDETCEYDMRQPIVLNGISDIVSQEDLLDRSIIIELLPIKESERKSEKQLIEDFTKDIPLILGGIIDILAKALAEYRPNSVKNPPRLADFYEYGYYIANAMGKGFGEGFCDFYKNLIMKQTQESGVNKELVEALDYFLDVNENYWKGTVGNLNKELLEQNENWEGDGCELDIPVTPNSLSREIHLIEQSLRKKGIYVTYGKNTKNCTTIEIRKKLM